MTNAVSLVFIVGINLLAADPLADRFGLVHATPEFCVELGVAWSRFDFTWSGFEKEQGKFDFGDYPSRLDSARRLGVRILPILDYGPAWNPDVSPADDETLELWSRYVERTVTAFKNDLPYWQVWNEPNLDFWKPKPDARAYVELLRRSYIAVKNAAPEAKVLGFNCSDIDLDFTEQVIRYGGLNYCDVLAFQPYRIAPEVGHFEEMRALRELLVRFGGADKPIWFTEMGWGSEHFPFSDVGNLMAERPNRRQAAFLVRYMTLIMAAGVDKVFWFAQSAGSAGLEDYKTHEKRASFYAYQHFIKTVGDYHAIREITPHGANGTYAYLFECPAQAVAIAWSARGERDLDVPGAEHAVEMRDMLGHSLPQPLHGSFRVTGEPVYVLFDSTPRELEQAASLHISSGQVWIEPDCKSDVKLNWDSRRSSSEERHPISIDFQRGVSVSTGRVELRPGRERVVTVRAAKRTLPGVRRVTFRSGDIRQTIDVCVMPKTLWRYKGASKGYLTPAVLKQDGRPPAILVGSYDSPELVCLSASGHEEWRYTDAQPIYGSPSVSNIRGDTEPEIVAAMPGLQTILALTTDGVLLWRARLPGALPSNTPQWQWTQPSVGDFDHDGYDEIVYSDPNGVVHCVDGAGSVVWSTAVSKARCDLPVCIADIQGDEQLEIAVASADGSIYVLSTAGQLLTQTRVGEALTSAPVVSRRDNGLAAKLYVADRGERLYCISDGKRLEWSAELGGTMDLGAGVVLRDCDGDGVNEVVATMRNHELRTYTATGSMRSVEIVGSQIRSTPVVEDIDGDGIDDVLIGSADWKLNCYGQNPWMYNAGNRIDASPAVTDLNGDGVNDIVLPIRGGSIVGLSTR